MSTLSVDTIQGKTTAGTVAMPSGFIIQTKTLTGSTSSTTINSTSYVDITGMSMSFTAKRSNSLLLFTLQTHVYLASGAGTWNGVDFKVLKDSTEIFTGGEGGGGGYGTATAGGSTSADRMMMYVTQNFQHSPNSTSAHTYKVQAHTTNGETGGDNEVNSNYYGADGRLIIMEIAQ